MATGTETAFEIAIVIAGIDWSRVSGINSITCTTQEQKDTAMMGREIRNGIYLTGMDTRFSGSEY